MPTPAIFPRIIDATMRSQWLTCHHAFYRRHCQGLVHDQVSIHLHFGACLAAGLEETRRQYCRGVSIPDAITTGAEYLIKTWGSFDAEPRTRTEQNKTLNNCILALVDYFKAWPLDMDPLQIHYHAGEPCIEFSAAYPIPGCYHPYECDPETGMRLPMIYSGRFDMIGDFEGQPWGLDDKTTGSVSSQWGEQWKLRGQFTGYTWLAQQWGVHIKGFLIRGLHILANSTNPIPDVIAPRPPWMVRAWLAQLQVDMNEMIHEWSLMQAMREYGQPDDPNDPPAHPFSQNFDNGCFSYGRPCTYLPLCSSPTPDRWEGEYIIKHWNPLTRTTEEP